MALGGLQVALPDDDAALVLQNPALMPNVSDRSINLGFLSYMQGCKSANASYVMAAGERGSWGVGAQLLGYGSMKEMDIEGIELGDFAALDMALSGGYAYTLTDHWAGGAMGKFVYSKYGHFSSVALAVDLGLNYMNDAGDFSASIVAANLGGQVKAYDDTFDRIPFDLQLGISKRLGNAPLRFSATLSRLNDWDEAFGRHLAIGVDVLLSDQIYIAAGYNFRSASQMKINDGDGSSAHGAGLSLGAGLQLERFKLNIGYGKYHVSASSLLFNIAYTL